MMQREETKPWKHLQSEKCTEIIPPDYNTGIVCGGISGNLVVLDLDHPSLYEKFSEYHDRTFIVQTGSKGYHLYFKYNDIIVTSKKLFDADHKEIDIKAEGGYVVAPRSTHPITKKLYEVICDKPILTIDLKTLQEKLQSIGFNPEQKTIKEISKGIKVGDRNDATFKYACYLVREHQLHGKGLELAVDELNKKHSPPLSESEIKVIVASALKYEAHNIKKSKGLNTYNELNAKIKTMLEDEQDIIDLSPLREYFKILKRDIIENLFNEQAGYKCKFKYGDPILLREITPELENVPVEFQAMIIAAGERQTYTEQADFLCSSCNNKVIAKCDQFYKMGIPKCKDCKIPCNIIYSSRILKSIQLIRIQEFLETARNNTPIEYDAEILDTNVGEAFMGDRKMFVAKFRSLPAKDYNQIVFEILEMRNLDQKAGCLPTEEELAEWKADPNIYDKVVKSIAPELYLRPELKETCMLSMAGGVSLNANRSNIHTMFIGDAQLAKSELLVAVSKIMVGSAYAMGRQASNAGLTIGMTKLHNGTMAPRAGLLPIHTNNLVCLDEVDKMKPEDREGALECMEQRTVTLNKVGYPNTRLSADTTIIAAGNPKNGKFNPDYPSVMDNFNLEVPFISRFDILWLLIDDTTENEDSVIRNHIRNFKSKSEYLTLEELQRFFSYVRTLTVTVPELVKDKLDEIHKKLRQISDLNELEIGWRLYYGLYRIASASAKLHLRTEVTIQDVELTERILMASIDSLKIEGKVKIKTKKQTKSDVFLTVWSDASDSDHTVDKEDFISLLSKCGSFNALTAITEFEKYCGAGTVELVNKSGRYRIV